MNITKLNNQSPFSFNETIFNQSTEITDNVVSIAQSQGEGYLGLTIMTVLWVYLMYELMRENGFFRMDLVNAGVVSSGIVVVIGFIMIVSTLITNYRHVIWYLTLFAFFIIAAYYKKKRGF